MNLLLVGYGVVGKAVYNGLIGKNNIDVLDLDESSDDVGKYPDYDGIILCLPTPAGPGGECDDFLVEQYIMCIRKEAPDIPILLKSTTSLELIKLLEDDSALTYNPEFLTENDSAEEFKHQKFAIFGGNNARFWYDIFVNSNIKMKKVRFTSMKNAAFAKYAINSFLATKVIFFNELRNLYSDNDFDTLTEIISLDKRIGKSHMMVPGHDLKYGFGGMCLPKDTSAFAISARNQKSPLKLLERVIKVNKELR